jgi:FMN-dependent NADH-azoreductase
MRVLHIIASPRGERSASLEAARAFIDAGASIDPGSEIDTLNVWETELPEFDGAALGAKYAGLEGRERTPDERSTWDKIEQLGKRFHDADLILFSTPMWNFGIPYRLKHLIDAVSQKDVLFTFDERGLLGMLTGRPVVVIAARGVALGPEGFPESFDFQVAYLRNWAQMVGIEDFHSLTVQKTLLGADVDRASRSAGRDEAATLARKLWPQLMAGR